MGFETLAGKVGVVTGASRGLGYEVARQAAEEGATVVAAARGFDEAELPQGEPEPGRIHRLRTDVTRQQEAEGLLDACEEAFGRVDFIVNNAGILGASRLHETTDDLWEALMGVHMNATFWTCRRFINLAMAAHRPGSIVNVGSILSFAGDGYLAAYTAMKSGVAGLTRAIAVDYGGEGIRANFVAPGDMETEMIEEYFRGTPDPAASRAEMESHYPAKRLVGADEVARAVIFLASDLASSVNGTSIVVDGGLLANAY